MNIRKSKIIYISLLVALIAVPALSQGLNWEGQTGAFITPFAYTSGSEAGKVGKPQIAFHYLNAGAVVGDSVQASITVGMFKRAEFGYTRTIKMDGDSAALSPLFKGGFNTFHGKLNVVSENLNKSKWVPAISVGFVARTQVKRVGGVIGNKEETSGDLYVVATKTITQVKGLPFLLSGGLKATNSSVFGVAGSAPDWTGRAFGAAAIVVKGPAKSTLIFGSEFAQQPHKIKGLAGATVPTSLTYFVRILPGEKYPFNLDFGVAQVVGKIMPGVDLKARHQFAMGMSYKF
ncbi:MAG: DUF3034 family protein [Pyrinomonadaceae bacterium]